MTSLLNYARRRKEMTSMRNKLILLIIEITKSNSRTFEFRALSNHFDNSYKLFLEDSSDEIFLIILNKSSKEKSKAWLRFDIKYESKRITIFVDFNVTYCFIARRIVDLLRLKLQLFSDRVQLENDKSIDIVDITKFTWRKNEFHISTSCMILNMKNDLILNENFWKKYRLTSDYKIISIRVW